MDADPSIFTICDARASIGGNTMLTARIGFVGLIVVCDVDTNIAAFHLIELEASLLSSLVVFVVVMVPIQWLSCISLL